MAPFLSDEWLAGVRADAPGVAACTVEITVLGTPDGDVKWHLTAGDDRVVAAGGALPGADVALTVPYDDMVAIVRGELDPSVAFMRGRMKTAGHSGRTLDVVAATARPRYHEVREAVAATTEF
jgi:hypothetical protein